MLYEGTIRFLERALGGFKLEDPAEYNETISNNMFANLRVKDAIVDRLRGIRGIRPDTEQQRCPTVTAFGAVSTG